MSTADKLNALVQTKADIKQALIDKGQNPSDVFSTYADAIKAIETGAKLPIPKETRFAGSTWDNGIPQEILDYINNPDNIKGELKTSTTGTLSYCNINNQVNELYFAPTRFGYFLRNTSICYRDDITESKITFDCKNLIDTVGSQDPDIALFGPDTISVKYASDYGVRAIIEFRNTSHIARFNQFMSGDQFIKIVGLDYTSCRFASDTMVASNLSANWLNSVWVKNFGTHPDFTNSKTFKDVIRWGLDGDDYYFKDGKESLIYTLIDNSFDRATAAYSACTITLSSYTKGVLTEEEIAQITAKGYTIA